MRELNCLCLGGICLVKPALSFQFKNSFEGLTRSISILKATSLICLMSFSESQVKAADVAFAIIHDYLQSLSLTSLLSPWWWREWVSLQYSGGETAVYKNKASWKIHVCYYNTGRKSTVRALRGISEALKDLVVERQFMASL